MATHHGKSGTLKIGSNAVAEIQSFSINETGDVAEDTAMGDTAKTFLPGITGWTGSLECSWDETDTNGQEALVPGTSLTLNAYPEGDGSGAKYLSGTIYVTSINWTTPRGGIVMRSFNFQGSGALSRSTV